MLLWETAEWMDSLEELDSPCNFSPVPFFFFFGQKRQSLWVIVDKTIKPFQRRGRSYFLPEMIPELPKAHVYCVDAGLTKSLTRSCLWSRVK